MAFFVGGLPMTLTCGQLVGEDSSRYDGGGSKDQLFEIPNHPI